MAWGINQEGEIFRFLEINLVWLRSQVLFINLMVRVLVKVNQNKLPDAIKKATEVAKRNLIKIPLKDGRTLHHDVKGKMDQERYF